MLYFKLEHCLLNERRSKSLVKDLVYEQPFGYRVVHYILLTFFYKLYIFFYNLTFKIMSNITNNILQQNFYCKYHKKGK